MAHTAVVTFTTENVQTILSQGGSQAWHLDADRARRSEYLVCVQNRRHAEFREPGAAHRAAFLLGRISDVVPSPKRPDRWFIVISEFMELAIPDAWNQRYPVQYTMLEDLGIDPGNLPPFRPVLPPAAAKGFGEPSSALVVAPRHRQPASLAGGAWIEVDTRRTPGRESWDRFDAVLAQIDRIPDLPAPFDPQDWDEHGLPR
jgi:hypothetical protein